jgi:tetratricopeptide (TPR) repeat protein
MTLRHVALVALAAGFASVAAAQMSVTTFGATDAQQCYQNAADDFSRDDGPCDLALKGPLSSEDRKKTFVNRGVILNRKGEVQAAVDDFNSALEIDGALAEAFLNRGNSYFLAARYQQAEADYEQSLRLGVRKPWAAWYNIGLAREARADAEGARAAYRSALELNPDFTPAQQKLANL